MVVDFLLFLVLYAFCWRKPDLADDALVLLTHVLPVVILAGRPPLGSQGGLLLWGGAGSHVHALPAVQWVPSNVDAAAVAADVDALAGWGNKGQALRQLHAAAAAGAGIVASVHALHGSMWCVGSDD